MLDLRVARAVFKGSFGSRPQKKSGPLNGALGPVPCQLVKTMHSTFELPQSLGEEIATAYSML
jgi:hypothetical protein